MPNDDESQASTHLGTHSVKDIQKKKNFVSSEEAMLDAQFFKPNTTKNTKLNKGEKRALKFMLKKEHGDAFSELDFDKMLKGNQ